MTEAMHPKRRPKARLPDSAIAGNAADRSLDDAVATAQAIMATVASPDRMLSEELIAERRREASDN